MKEARRLQRTATGLAALVALAASACAHTVVIETEPQGAAVAIDGTYVGNAPVVADQRTGIGGRMRLEVSADAYETATVVVTQSEWFWWPALIAATPLLGLGVVWVPFIGPVITLTWALVTSPTLFALAFIQRYPERVLVTLQPRLLNGLPQPSDTWLIPDDYDPNPPPLPALPTPLPNPTAVEPEPPPDASSPPY
ncbi:MAG: PEGA domain-containing protein [Deltaproteobacteria bacterium]|nr:PEGA domain-containing protein [Deltaproteobacteria bacterium]